MKSKHVTAITIAGLLAIAVVLACANEPAQAQEAQPATAPAPQAETAPLAFTLKVDQQKCWPWKSASCAELEEGQTSPLCTFTIVKIADGTVCLGEACPDGETLRMTMRGEVAAFCGNPAP